MQCFGIIKNKTWSALLCGAAILTPCLATGATGMIDFDIETAPTLIGAGVGVVPDYRGSDDYTFGYAPLFRYTLPGQQRYIQLIANELAFNFLDSKMVKLGPLVNYHFGRDNDIDDPVVSQMKEIDDTIEVGAFGDLVWALSNDQRHRFAIGAKYYQDVGDESDGWRANVNARYWLPVAKPVDLNFSIGGYYQDDNYADHYFGVNRDNVGDSGLPLFAAGGGMNEYYMLVGGLLYLSENWIVSAGIRGSVIAGDPADSPIVEEHGESTQWMGGIGIGYALW